jgi:carbamoyltransferase
MNGAYLGPACDDDECARTLQQAGARFERLGGNDLIERAASDLADGKGLGWFQGRMMHEQLDERTSCSVTTHL